MFLDSIPQNKPTAKSTGTEPSSPMAVQTEPAPLSSMDPAELEEINQDALYETGCELLDLWHVPEAIDVLETLVAKDPQHQEAYLKLVECYSHPTVGAEQKAAECWERAWNLATEAGRDTTWVMAFRRLFIDLTPSSAIADLNIVVGRDAGSVDVRLLLARSLFLNGDTKGAVKHLEALLDEDQGLGQVRELLVQCKLFQDETEQAVTLARDLVALYPQEPYPHVLLARVLLARGNVEEAAEIGDNALLLDARYGPAIVSRAYAYVAQGEVEAARVSFEKLQMFNDPILSSVAMEGMAYIDFLYGHFEQASESMDEAIRLAMSHGATRRGMIYAFGLMEYLCELGRIDAAEAVLDRWVKRQAEIPAGLGALRIRISQGSLPDIQGMLEEMGRDEQWRSWMRSFSLEYADIEALTAIQRKDFKRALSVLDARPRLAGGTRRAYLAGYARFQSGDAEGAAHFFEQARVGQYGLGFPYHSDPVLFVQSVYFLGDVAFARGDRDTAARCYRDFLTFWGESDWELQAVEKARDRLESLAMTPE
jgi:tetratricopeptide (TPR) repeat protein